MKNLLLLCIVAFCARDTQAVCQHSVVAPKGLRLDTIEDVYVDFHGDCGERVSVAASLMSLPNGAARHDEFAENEILHERKPVKISLEALTEHLEELQEGIPIYKAELKINYCLSPCGGKWVQIPPITLLLNATHGYIFMTTNRPAYRPGETVRIALAVTNQDLMVENERRPVHILIKTPVEKITVKDSGIKFARLDGFIDFTYQIPDNPVKGIWWAEAQIGGVKMAEKSFVVETYELPTFDVKIFPRYHFVLPTQTHIEGKITAEYSYGEKVDGFYYMSFKLARENEPEEEFYKIPRSFGVTAAIARGERRFRIDLEEHLNLRDGETIQSLVEQNARIIITASVTGLTESIFESDYVDDIVFTDSPFFIDYSRSARFYLPNVVYELKLTVRDIVSRLPLTDIPVRIAYGNRRPKDVMSDKNGEVYHQIDGLAKVEETFVVTTHSENFDRADQTRVNIIVRRHAAPRYLAIRLNKQAIDVGEQQHITFGLGNNSPKDIRYFVLSRGKFVHTDTKTLNRGQVGEATTSFEVTSDMVPNSRVIAYYILDNKMTSNSAWFDVTNQCKKELKITPEKDVVEPGSLVGITIEGTPNMPVHLFGVDRAAYFVHNGTRVSRNQLWAKMEAYDTGCSRKGGLDAINVFEEAGLTINTPLSASRTFRHMYCSDARPREKRNAAPAVQESETYLSKKLKLCGKSGARKNLYQMTCEERRARLAKNWKVEDMEADLIDSCLNDFMRSCEEMSYSWEPELERSAASADKKANEVRGRVRKDFAENWDFPRISIRDNGFLKIKPKAKDSITTFELDAFGMGVNAPMCVAETKYIKVFRDFFIQLYLPYSVKLREQATIRVAVFNYDKRARKEVNVFVKHSNELCSRYKSDEFKFLQTLNIAPLSASSSSFTILPIKIPNGKRARIEILAQSEDGNSEDTVQKDLLIEEQGHLDESSGTIVLEALQNGAEKVQNLKFTFPNSSIIMPSSRKCVIYAYAHPMGPNIEIDPFDKTINNIGNYIKQPRGCGEQNMILIAPVVYIHKYRVSAMGDEVTVQQSQQVVVNIEKGYANELGHRSNIVQDRAFAVWKTHKPSTWLNAFVTKVFAEAKEFWEDMDTRPLCSALDWMLQMQQGDGRFVENFRVYHREMIGQVTDDITLTAYVTISLVETLAVCPDMTDRVQAAANDALQYLRERTDLQNIGSYTLALGAYAVAISETGKLPSGEALRWNRRLRDMRENDGEYIFWPGTRAGAATIETTAYALLAEVTLNGITEENAELTRNIAHFLVSKRNANGGHRSTQDTVVAMQALSTYQTVLEASVTQAPPPTNLNVGISSLDGNEDGAQWEAENINLRKNDVNRPDELEVPPTVFGGISVSVIGVGTGSLSYRCTWRQFANDDNCQFQLSVEVIDDESGDADTKIVKVEVSKRGDDPAQMSIVDVGILSGFVPDENSVKELCTEEVVDYQADRYEITENTVKFYLSQIDDEPTKLAFKIKRRAVVTNGQPATVSAYDYYEPDIKCTKFYTLQGDYQIRTTGCNAADENDEETCKCSAGDCPICRKRDQQLRETACSKHRSHRRICGELDMCKTATCFPLHAEMCKRAYVYVVSVKKVGKDTTPGFKYFDATVEQVFRTTANHQRAEGTTVKFLIRDDCFERCNDPRFQEIALKKKQPEKHYIAEERRLLVYGSRVTKDDKGGYVYDLTGDGGMEVLVDPVKCNKLKRKQNRNPTQNQVYNICVLESLMKAALNLGCD